MYCKNCGERINDDMVFCPKCGVSCMNESLHVVTQSKKNKIIGLATICIIVGIILIIVLKITGIIGGNYEKVIKKCVKSIEKEDGKLLCSLYAPDYIDYMVGEGTFYSNIDSYIMDLTEECEEKHEYLSSGIEKHPNITYTIIEKKKLSNDELAELNDRLEEYYDFKRNSVRTAYHVTFRVFIPGGNHSYTYEQYMLKIGGRWYMNRGDLGL